MTQPGTKTESRRRAITAVQMVLIAFAFIAFVWVAFKLLGYWNAQKEYHDIQHAYAGQGDSIEFAPLLAKYPDTVAWIRCEALPTINYPVMQADNNDFYLHNGPDGAASIDGSIFLDYRNTSVSANPHAIVYGHNMRDGSMFGTLTSYQDEAFYKDNPDTFTIYTPQGTFRYQIFAVNIVDPTSETFMVGFTDKAVFGAFVQKLKDNSLYDTGVNVNENDQVVTLSTCSSENRLVVSGKRVAA